MLVKHCMSKLWIWEMQYQQESLLCCNLQLWYWAGYILRNEYN